VTFSAYELENDCTYTYPITYSDFDHLFRFNSELLNPKNVEGRYNWVIARLQFVPDIMGKRRMILDPEVLTNDADDGGEDGEGDDEELAASPKKQGVQPAAAGAGRVDAATRAKLLQELDTHDDEKLHRTLVKSEAARKRFIAELFAKRQLEQLKAAQRLQKADEEREARLAKLDIIKQQQLAKAQQHKEAEENKKSTQAQLEVLLKQKEAQAIRRLIQEKDEADRSMSREKDAARQRRKMQERSAQEVAAIENQRAQQLARNREIQVQKREAMIKAKDKEEYQAVKAWEEEQKSEAARVKSLKRSLIAEHWKRIVEIREDKAQRKEAFYNLEKVRDMKLAFKADRRAKLERENWEEMRMRHQGQETKVEYRRKEAHKEYLMNWQLDATKRAVAVRDNELKNSLREKSLQERAAAKRRQQQEFSSSSGGGLRGNMGASARSRSHSREPAPPPLPAPSSSKTDMEVTRLPASPKWASPKSGVSSSPRRKSFSPGPGRGAGSPGAGRSQKHGTSSSSPKQRRANKEEEEAEAAALEAAAPLDRKAQKERAKRVHMAEVLRLHDKRVQVEKHRHMIEHARLEKEIAEEEAARAKWDRDILREETFVAKEPFRTEASVEREVVRNKACVAHIKALPLGKDLPMHLIF